jgi:WD40 repeat protein
VLWNVTTREKRATFNAKENRFLRLAFSPDGRRLACGGDDCDIRICDLATGATECLPLNHQALVSVLRFAPDGRALAAGYTSGIVKLWDVARGTHRDLIGSDLRHKPIAALAFSPDGMLLAAGSAAYGTKLLDVVTGRERAGFRDEDEGIREVAFTPSGQNLVELTQTRLVRLRDVATGSTRIVRRCGGKYCAALTADARFLAAGDDGAIVRVWDLGAL